MPSVGVRGDSAGCGAVDVAGVVLVDLAGLLACVVGAVVGVVVPEGADVPVARLGIPEFGVVELDGVVAVGLVVSGFVVPGFIVSGFVVSGLVELVDFDRFLDHIHCLPSIVFSGFRDGLGRAVDAGPPLVGLVLTAELFERGRVSTVERRRPGVGGRGVQLWNLQLTQCGCGIPEVQTRSGHRDGELDLHRRLERGTVDGPPELEGALRTTETALAVHHHRELVVASGDPSVRAELSERRREVAQTVGSDRGGLADDSHASSTARRAQRMLVRFFRVRVDEQCRGDEVSCHPVRVVLAEGLELGTRHGVEIAGIDLLGDLRVVVARADRPSAVRVTVFPVVTGSLTETSTCRAVAVAESLPLGTTVAGGSVVVATERTVVAAAAERTVAITTGPIIVPTERTVPITTGPVVVPTERTVVASAAHGTVTITTGPIIVPTERTVPITTGPIIVPTERTVVASAAHGTITITTRPVIVPTERTIPITTRPIIAPTERTIPITTRPIIVPTERTVVASAAHGTITITTRTVIVPTERTIPITTRPVIAPTERTIPITTGPVIAPTERTIPITTRPVIAPTERTVPITTGPVIVPTERTIVAAAAHGTVTIATGPVIAPTGRTVSITTRTVSCGSVRTPRRTIVPGTAIAEVTARGPAIRAVAPGSIAAGPTTFRARTFATFEVTRARGPATAVAFTSRPIRTVSVTPVSSLFVVVRHRSSSLRADDSCLGDRPLCRCVVLGQSALRTRAQFIMNRTQSRPRAALMKQKMAAGPHESSRSRWRADGHIIEKKSGGVLLSHKVPLAVPSALRGLASGFGM
jgi:hypothetical protein